MENKLKKQLTNRLIVLFFLIFIQLLVVLVLVFRLRDIAYWIDIFLSIISYGMVIYVVNRKDNMAYKLAWSILILLSPIAGGVLYLMFGGRTIPKKLRVANLGYNKHFKDGRDTNKVLEDLKEHDLDAYKVFNYGYNVSSFDVYQDTDVTFYEIGEKWHEALLEELVKAKHFILMEYFIIEEGKMWNSILEVLKQKVKEKVKVILIYDDFGCATNIPSDYYKELRKYGIEAYRFNPLRPALAVQMNNRDHRKICVIDNNVGFCGGVNLADEYINEKVRFGHWKDNAVKLHGKAVTTLTLMFLQMYAYLANNNVDYKDYIINCDKVDSCGYVQGYCDSPNDNEDIGLNMHINLINAAKKYVYIYTPYLVITAELEKALILASKSGVEVIICTPHIPDKWYVFLITRSSYQSLIEAGVKIYEYTPGFIHAKSFIVDGEYGLCGTVNTDYRSYYLHYECGVLYYKVDAIKKMEEDFLDTLKKSQKISLDDCKEGYLGTKILQAILKLFAPLF